MGLIFLFAIFRLRLLNTEYGHGIVNFVILPLFAFVNAGVVLGGGSELIGGVSIAVALGLLIGKFIGIFSFTWHIQFGKWKQG